MARLAAELRRRFARVVDVVKDPLTEVHEPVKLIHTFRSEEDLAPWELVLDRTYGGASEASLSMGPNGFGVFEGTINDDIGGSQVLKRGGFCGIRYAGRTKDTNLGYYDAFMLRVRADDRLYLFNVGSAGAWTDGLYQSAFQRPAEAEDGEWGQLTLPFSRFNQTHEGFMLEQQHTMDTRHVDSLGLFAAGEPGDFRIELDGIIACRRSEMWKYLKAGEQQSPGAQGTDALH
eukprot:COSAG02_NODE_212_length_28729_cov_45.980196_2_plen_232_part_00